LGNLIAQIRDGVEVNIVDGASTDGTDQIVAEYQTKARNIRYLREPSNSGIDAGFDAAVEMARGEYCWLMSDDDFLTDGAVDAVLAEIDSGHSVIIVNAEVRDRNLSELVGARILRHRANRIYLPVEREAFFVDTANYLSFIGCVIIRKDLWCSRDRQRYYGTEFVHVGVIFQKPLPQSALVMSKPLVSIRYGQAQWRARQFQIWMFNWPGLIWSFTNYSTAAKRRVCHASPWRRPKVLLLLRAKGSYSVDEYRAWIEPRLTSPVSKFWPKLIARIPGILVNCLSLVYFTVYVRDMRTGIADLRDSPYYWRTWLKIR
jgi:glycosyltransferase involved in cell wall biosynthesis